MIKTKKELKEYIKKDLDNNYLSKPIFFDFTKKYIVLLRKLEFHLNNKHKIKTIYYKIRFRKMCQKSLTFISPNTFGPGLSIGHFGCIYINDKVIAGSNCRIHENVNIGTTNGSSKAPKIGDNVFVGSGAKIIGDVSVADDVCIGAGAVVVKSITEAGTTWGGVPARKISDSNSHSNIKVLKNK